MLKCAYIDGAGTGCLYVSLCVSVCEGQTRLCLCLKRFNTFGTYYEGNNPTIKISCGPKVQAKSSKSKLFEDLFTKNLNKSLFPWSKGRNR